MSTNWMLTAAVVAMSVTAGVRAQSAKAMRTPSKRDAMSMTYTGGGESVNHGGRCLLTKVDGVGVESMRGDMTMKHHEDTTTKGDADNTMQHEQTPLAVEKMDAMPSKSFALAGSANLSKHVGQKISVTGSLFDGSMGMMRHDVSTLAVKTLKVIAKSCS